MVYTLCFALFLVGLYCVLTKKNTVKIVVGLGIMEYATNLFLVLLGYRKNGVAPILDKATNPLEFLARAVDPIPQALVLTAIVIGLGVLPWPSPSASGYMKNTGLSTSPRSGD